MNAQTTKWIIAVVILVLAAGGFIYLNKEKQKSYTNDAGIVEEKKDIKEEQKSDDQTIATSSENIDQAGSNGSEIISEQQTNKIDAGYDQKVSELEAREEAGENINWEKEMDKMADELDSELSGTEKQLMSETIEE